MPKAIVKEEQCGTCGAGIRSESLFCFNCGSELAAKAEDPPAEETEVSTHADLPSQNGTSTNGSSKDVVLPGKAGPGKLRSASDIRRRADRTPRTPVKVVWEPSTRSPAIFVVGTLLLAAVTAALLGLAIYLK